MIKHFLRNNAEVFSPAAITWPNSVVKLARRIRWRTLKSLLKENPTQKATWRINTTSVQDLRPLHHCLESVLTFGFWHTRLSSPAAAQRWFCLTCLPLSGSTDPLPPVANDILSQQACRGTRMIHTRYSQQTVHIIANRHTLLMRWLVLAYKWGVLKNHLTQWTTRRGFLTGKRHLSQDTDSARDYRPASLLFSKQVSHGWKAFEKCTACTVWLWEVYLQDDTVRWSFVESRGREL